MVVLALQRLLPSDKVQNTVALLQSTKRLLQVNSVELLSFKNSTINWAGLINILTTIGIAINTNYHCQFKHVVHNFTGCNNGVCGPITNSFYTIGDRYTNLTPTYVSAVTALYAIVQLVGFYQFLSKECSPHEQPFPYLRAVSDLINTIKSAKNTEDSFPTFKKEWAAFVLGIGGIITGTYLQNRLLGGAGVLLNLASQVSAFIKAKKLIKREQNKCQMILTDLADLPAVETPKLEAPKTETTKKPLFAVKPEQFKGYIKQFEAKVRQRRTDLPIADIWDTLKSAYSKFLPEQQKELKAEYDKGESLFSEYQDPALQPATKVEKPKTESFKPLFQVKPENFKSYVTQFEDKVKNRRTDLPMTAIWETLKAGYAKFLPKEKTALKAEYDKGERLFKAYQTAVGSAAPVSAAKPKTR
ncbi:MAG TPA: hypothetical protein VLG44_08815 [Chlamydiales bacterium]|nr:hypothetical protein [Chlamydiales bacterium]